MTNSLTAITLLGTGSLMLAINASALPADRAYTAILLGTLGGNDSFAEALNDRADVVGSSYTAEGDLHAFLWNATSAMQDLGTLGGSTSGAAGINNRRQIAGWSLDSGFNSRAVLWEAGGMQDLGDLGGGLSAAYAINRSGQIVGQSWTGSAWHAVLWDAAGMTDLGTLGGRDSIANAIADTGEVAGYSDRPDFNRHAFMWRAGVTQDLGTLGGAESFAYGINSSMQVAGLADDEAGRRHAFLWQGGAMNDLGMLIGDRISWALGINEAGLAVGYSYLNDDPHLTVDLRAVVYDAGAPIDLNCLAQDLHPWVLEEAAAVNEREDVAAIARVRVGEASRARAVLLRRNAAAVSVDGPLPGMAGQRNAILIRGATPAARVVVVVGGRSACAPVHGCADLQAAIVDPSPLGDVVADQDGKAILEVLIPPDAQGRTVLVQAVEPAACRASNVSATALQ